MNRLVVLLGCFALLLAPSLLVTRDSSLQAQDDAKKAKLRWYGQSMFQLETPSKKLIVFDPHAIPTFSPPRLIADITLISHPHNDHNELAILKDKGKVFEGVKAAKGMKTEWNAVDEKVEQIRVRSLGTFHDATGGMTRGR